MPVLKSHREFLLVETKDHIIELVILSSEIVLVLSNRFIVKELDVCGFVGYGVLEVVLDEI